MPGTAHVHVCYFLDTTEKVVDTCVRIGPYDEARSFCREHLHEQPSLTAAQIWDDEGKVTWVEGND